MIFVRPNKLITPIWISFRILKMEDPEKIHKIACDLEHHMDTELKDRFVDLLGLKEDIKNVDNFIVDDRLPKHIKTNSIHTDHEIEEAMKPLEQEIIEKLTLSKDQIEELSKIFDNFNIDNKS